MTARYDVAVVGFGPTGLVAAGLLGQLGLQVIVFDKQLEIYDKPRAISLDHEIARIFQQLGVWAAVEPHTEPFTDSVYYGVDGDVIRRMSTVSPPYPLAHWPSMVFSQPAVEAALRAHISELPNVTVRLGFAVSGVHQSPDQVQLAVSGLAETVSASYVIACDGASSQIRSQLELPLQDLDFDEPWLVIDVLVNEQGQAKLPKTSVQYCRPSRPSTYLICPGNHRRWEIAINPGDDPLELATPQGAWRMLEPWLTPQDGVLWRQASYRFHALVAQQWQAGRVFIAGDAAHQQPPFLGQGMCQGIRDVANLSWKIGAVLIDKAHPDILKTYAQERSGHVSALTQRIKHIGQLIGERNLEQARARDRRLLEEALGVIKPTPRQDVQPALVHGLLAPQLHAARGTLFYQPWLRTADGSQVRMDDVMGYGWRLFSTLPSLTRDLQARLRELQIRAICLGSSELVEVDAILSHWFERHQVSFAVVRPDHYVYGVYRQAQELATALFELKKIMETGLS